MDMISLPAEVTEQIPSIETVIWAAPAAQGIRFRPQDIFLVPFSLFWGGGVVFWEITVFRSHAPIFFRLFGMLFVLVGSYMVLFRFVVDALLRKYTYYVLTDRAAYVCRTKYLANMRRFGGDMLQSVSVRQGKDGCGNITFGATANPFSAMRRWSAWSDANLDGFQDVRDVKSVREKILAIGRGS